MPDAYFVTGTDTEVGKTLVTASLLWALGRRSLVTAALKPVAAGAYAGEDGWRNEDGDLLQRYQSLDTSYAEVNPVVLPEPLSPHLAAQRAGRHITVSRLVGFVRGAMLGPADVLLVEGAGGWRVPLNARELLSSLPRELNLPVILVVGLKLGCLNHALLTAEAVARDGLRLAGWVANQIDPDMAAVQANIDTLRRHLPGPFLGHVPWLNEPTPERAGALLDPSPLIPVAR